jgi:hypothetical protein
MPAAAMAEWELGTSSHSAIAALLIREVCMEVVKITHTKMQFIAPAIYGRKLKHHLSTRTKDIPAWKTLYEKARQPLTTQR